MEIVRDSHHTLTISIDSTAGRAPLQGYFIEKLIVKR